MNYIAKTLSTGLLVSSLFNSAQVWANAEDLYVKAQHFYQNKEVNAAVIELKNALRESPDHIKSRLLLADIFIGQLNGSAAEDEIRKAIKAGAKREEYLSSFAQALHIQHKSDELLNELQVQPNDSANVQAFIHAMHGEAYFFKQDFEQAKKFYLKATALFPEHPMGNTGLAKLDFLADRLEQAQTIISEVLKSHPDFFEALLIKGDINSREGKHKEAIDAYTQALAQYPNHLLARLGRADNYVQVMQLDEATRDVDALMTINNDQVKALSTFLKGKILFLQKKPDEALAILKNIDKLNTNSSQHWMLKGQIYYEREQYDLAAEELRRYVHANPEHLIAHKLLANALLKLEQPDKAIIALSKFEATAPNDVGLLTLMGEANLQQGKNEQALTYFERALAIDPEQDPIRTKLAITYLKLGKTNTAIAELEKTRTTAQDYPESEIFLITTLIEQKMFDKAQVNTDDFIKKNPKNPIGYNLKGLLQLEQNQLDEANRWFDESLKLNKDFFTAYINKSRVAIKQGKDDIAEENLRKALAIKPGEIKSIIGIASIYERQDVKKAQKWLETSWKDSKDSVEIGLALLQIYLKTENKLLALNHATDLNVRFPDNMNVQFGLVSAHVLNKNFESAFGLLNQLIAKNPDNQTYSLILAKTKNQAGDYAGAIDIYDKILRKTPNFLDAWLSKIQLQIEKQKMADAISTAQALQKAYPEQPTGYELEGNIYSSQQQWDKALSAYMKAFDLTGNALNVDKIHEIYLKMGKSDEALAILSKWLKDNPNNTQIGFKYATALLTAGKLQESFDIHKQLLQQLEGNLILLNNLAWLSHHLQHGDTQQYIDAILAKDPKEPTILDTVGWILIEKKDKKGLSLLQTALASAPDNPEILHHTGVAELNYGDKSKAKTLLQQVVNQHPDYAQINDVKAQLQQLP